VGIHLRPHDLRQHATTFASRSGTLPLNFDRSIVILALPSNCCPCLKFFRKLPDILWTTIRFLTQPLTDQWDSMETPLIGISANIETIRKQIERVANTSLNVLICGETGVGKEVVVMQLHVKSNRCNKAFVKVNCAALPDTLLESEMFGYEQI
jgi:Cdc6-like AAA superfamily ATPase